MFPCFVYIILFYFCFRGTPFPNTRADEKQASKTRAQAVFEQWDLTLRALGNPTKLRDPEAFDQAVGCLGEVLGVFYNDQGGPAARAWHGAHGGHVTHGAGHHSSNGGNAPNALSSGGVNGQGGGSGSAAQSQPAAGTTRTRKTFTFSRKKGEKAAAAAAKDDDKSGTDDGMLD